MMNYRLALSTTPWSRLHMSIRTVRNSGESEAIVRYSPPGSSYSLERMGTVLKRSLPRPLCLCAS
jgi:hypothetical protein